MKKQLDHVKAFHKAYDHPIATEPTIVDRDVWFLRGTLLGEELDEYAMACEKEDCKSNLDMFHYIKDNLDFDQLIWEFGSEPKWLHVSYNNKKDNRNQVLVTKKQGVYSTWS